MDIKDNKIMLLEEDLECVHLYLDDKQIPRKVGEYDLSIVGRIKWLENNFQKELSKLESFYLKENSKDRYLVEPHWMDQ